MTSRQAPVTAVGLTQASRVMAVLRCRDAESLMFTRALLPLNDRASPYRPAAHVALLIVPVLPLPEASATAVPVPSLNEYAATRAGAVRSSSNSSESLALVWVEGRRSGCRAPERTTVFG